MLFKIGINTVSSRLIPLRLHHLGAAYFKLLSKSEVFKAFASSPTRNLESSKGEGACQKLGKTANQQFRI